jgi:hypothetical protein
MPVRSAKLWDRYVRRHTCFDYGKGHFSRHSGSSGHLRSPHLQSHSDGRLGKHSTSAPGEACRSTNHVVRAGKFPNLAASTGAPDGETRRRRREAGRCISVPAIETSWVGRPTIGSPTATRAARWAARYHPLQPLKARFSPRLARALLVSRLMHCWRSAEPAEFLGWLPL